MTNEGDKENPIDLTSIEDQVFDFTNDPDVIIASPPRKIKRPKQLAATPIKKQKKELKISPEAKLSPPFNDNPVDAPVPRDYSG